MVLDAQAMGDTPEARAEAAARFLSGLANPRRLRVLCQLAGGEKTVTELCAATGVAQTSMSQHLAKLKAEGIVSFRREHRALYYFISNPAALQVMRVIYAQFCAPAEELALPSAGMLGAGLDAAPAP